MTPLEGWPGRRTPRRRGRGHGAAGDAGIRRHDGELEGRLKEAQYGFGWTEAYTYTNAGLPLTKSLTWPSTSGAGILTLTAEHDNEGRRTSLRYPTHYTSGTYAANNGRKLIYGFDSVGRLSTVNQETGGALISAINYNAASQVTSWTRAWDTNPSASETFDFNAAGQLTRQKLLNPSTLVDVEYRYSASNNDGRLWQRKNWVSGEEVTYQYDQLGRLSTAATTSTAWRLSWAFDGFGNRLQQSVTKGSAPVHSVAVDGLTNRMVGQTYDANGNMQIPGLFYDVDNRLSADGVYSYRYSSTNQRIRVEGASGVFAWFYGFEGEMLAVYKHEKQGGDANRTWPVLQTDKERVYALGRLLRMGTQDVVVDRGASVIRHGAANLAYYPYGEEQGGASANDRAKYATYTRDASTGLDYAWNRMYKVEWGRFTSADPWTSSSRMTQPEGWNRFAYSGSDPINWHDPQGLDQLPVPGGPYIPDGGAPTFSITATPRWASLVPAPVEWLWGDGGLSAKRGPDPEELNTRYAAGIGTNPARSSWQDGWEDAEDPCDEHKANMNATIEGQGMPGGKSLLARVVENVVGSSARFAGHQEQINNYRNRLIGLLDKWRDDKCGDPPSGVQRWIDESSEQKVRLYHDGYHNYMEFVQEIALSSALGYISYRAIRLIPSIVFWPSLPVNLVVP